MSPPLTKRGDPTRRDGAAPEIDAASKQHDHPQGTALVRLGDVDIPGWASRYAAAGLPVLPLHSMRDGRCTCRTDCGRNAGKHPITRHGKDDASTDLQQVTAWWQHWQWANIGIRLPAGVIVLDVDPRNGGAVALLGLTREHGHLPPTLAARTGSGGLHIWLAYAGPARGHLCPGVDLKTDRGYVVAPPSVHASGGRYEWLTMLPTAPAPRWVRRMIAPPPPPVAQFNGGTRHGDGLVQMVATAPEGQRNNALNRAAYRVFERGGDPRVIAEIHSAALSAGLSPVEVNKTIHSAARAVRGR